MTLNEEYKTVKSNGHRKYGVRKLMRSIRAKRPFLFAYQKTLLKLTVVLLLACYIVIRGSSWPLLSNNSVLFLLFYSNPQGDKTLYNIGISVIAAYIFYVFQVFIPENHKNKRDMRICFSNHRYEIFLLNQYLLAWKEFLGCDLGYCHFIEFNYKMTYNISGSVNKMTYPETIDALKENLGEIIGKPDFDNFDVAYQEFIIEANSGILGHLKYMDDEFPHWTEEDLHAEDYEKLNAIVFDDMRKYLNVFCSIAGYKPKLITISDYNGKSEFQKMAEKL